MSCRQSPTKSSKIGDKTIASPHASQGSEEFDFGNRVEQMEDEDTRDDSKADVLSPSQMVDEFGNQLSSCEFIDLL